MKLVHFNTFEGGGGAAKASLALHQAMLDQGVDASLIVYRKRSSMDSTIGRSTSKFGVFFDQKIIPRLVSVMHSMLFRPLEMWSFGMFGEQAAVHAPEVKEADIISLSWVSWFLDVEIIGQLLKQNKPVVWTCYDMWAFTGGCHYAGDCRQFASQCGECPQLRSSHERDISRWLWNKKKRTWDTDNLTIVCPSHWLAADVRASGLMKGVRVEVIPTGIDESIFKPQSKADTRLSLGLPQNKKLILFIASRGFANERKGGKFLEESLDILYDDHTGCLPEVVVLGRTQGTTMLHDKYTIHSRSFNDDLLLAKLYAACDLLAAPSIADTLPLTVLQAMACGTPCIAFDTGGMGDVIEHLHNGYLAQAFDVNEFARGINDMLDDNTRLQAFSLQSIKKIKSGFTLASEAKQYLGLYEELLSSSAGATHG